MIDDLRSILSRWRLSNHKLKIETGRYTVPLTPREERKCVTCNVVEDEYHALFICSCHQEIRTKYNNLHRKYTNVKSIFNPERQDILPLKC